MKVAILTTDSRECFKDYGRATPYFGTAPEALLQGLELLPDLEVHVVCCARQVMTSPEKIAPNIFYHALYVPKLGWMRTLYQGCIRATRERLRVIQPDLVHGQGTERDCSLSAVFSGFPSVLTIHGNMRLIARVNRVRPFSFLWLAARLEAFTVPRSEGVVCITRYTRDAMADLAKRTWVVPNAVDSAFFNLTPQPEEVPMVLCVGHVCVRKNQNAFIRALDALAGERRFRVVFLGYASKGQPYDDEFLGLIAARPWCSYEGWADREKLKAYLQRASVLALPSLEDNCPMVVLEAMAAGLPVLAANVGGLPDLVEDGVTGVFCDPLDAASMSAGLKRLLADPAAAAKLAQTAKQRALERFHPKAIAQRHFEIYREVLEAQTAA